MRPKLNIVTLGVAGSRAAAAARTGEKRFYTSIAQVNRRAGSGSF
ncbi:hypothetical protein [Sporomusa termitida]|nr:hypothetical protein [Sporomusa termitida]